MDGLIAIAIICLSFSVIIRLMAFFIEGGILEDSFYKVPVDYMCLIVAVALTIIILVMCNPIYLICIPIYFIFGYICLLQYYVYLKKIEHEKHNIGWGSNWVDSCKIYIAFFCEFYWPVIFICAISMKIFNYINIKNFIKTPEKEWDKVKSKLERK